LGRSNKERSSECARQTARCGPISPVTAEKVNALANMEFALLPCAGMRSTHILEPGWSAMVQ